MLQTTVIDAQQALTDLDDQPDSGDRACDDSFTKMRNWLGWGRRPTPSNDKAPGVLPSPLNCKAGF